MPGEPGPADNPGAPYVPEDGVYQALVSQFFGLRRAGADPFSAALITAAQLAFAGMADPVPPHQQDEQTGDV